MKLRAFIVIYISILLIGCKKNPSSSDSGLYQINFKVSGFSQTIVDWKDQRVSLSPADHIEYLSVFIYKDDGSLFRQVNQQVGSENFGIITEMLPEGNYTLVFWGSKYPLNVSQPGTFSKAKLNMMHTDDDLFYYKAELSVADDQTLTVVLDRIVGSLELNVEDTLLPDVTRVGLAIQNETTGFSFTGNLETTPLKANTIKDIGPDDGRTNFTMNAHVLNCGPALTVIISCYDSSNRTILTKEITEVYCQPNKRTVLSGKLFAQSTAGFEIDLNAGWDPDPIEKSF